MQVNKCCSGQRTLTFTSKSEGQARHQASELLTGLNEQLGRATPGSSRFISLLFRMLKVSASTVKYWGPAVAAIGGLTYMETH